jgi:hypothetical protein
MPKTKQMLKTKKNKTDAQNKKNKTDAQNKKKQNRCSKQNKCHKHQNHWRTSPQTTRACRRYCGFLIVQREVEVKPGL